MPFSPSFHSSFHGSAFHGAGSAHNVIIGNAQRSALIGAGAHGHGGVFVLTEPTAQELAEQKAFDAALQNLHEPKGGALNLVSLARSEFKNIDRDHDGTVYGTEMYSSIMDAKSNTATREAAALLYRRFYAGARGHDHGWTVGEQDLSHWEHLLKIRDDFNERNQYLRSYTYVGAGCGAVMGGLLTMLASTYSKGIASRLGIALPVGMLATAGIGALANRWYGMKELDWDLAKYDSALPNHR